MKKGRKEGEPKGNERKDGSSHHLDSFYVFSFPLQLPAVPLPNIP